MSSSYSSSHASSSSGSGGGGGGGGGAKKQQSLRSLKSSSNSSSRLLGMTASDAQGRLFRGTELSSSTATLPKKFRKQAVDTQVFNKFALAKRGSAGKGKGKGKAADNLLPYDKIVVPKLNRAGKVSLPELAPGELDNMWLVGFQDYEADTRVEKDLDEISDFIKLPGGRLPPAISQQVYELGLERTEIEAAEAEEDAKRDDPCDLEKLNNELYQLSKKVGNNDPAVVDKRKKKAKKGRATRATKRAQGIYGEENRRIRRVIEEGQPLIAKKVLRARLMEDLFERQRQETLAALKIQRIVRRFKRRLAFYNWLATKDQAASIQKIWRGYKTRRTIVRWWARRIYLVTKIQAVLRGMFTREHLKHYPTQAHAAATKIQKMVRGLAGRKRFVVKHRHHSAVAIQRVWRGSVDRGRTDTLWLTLKVIAMQKIVRGHLGRMRFFSVLEAVHPAASDIQRIFRARNANRKRNRLLYKRSIQQRMDMVSVLRADAVYFDDALALAERRLEESPLQSDIKAQQKLERKHYDKVYELEFSYLKYKRELMRLSPRAIKQNFTEDIENRIDATRKLITEEKLETLFRTSREARRLEESLVPKLEEIAELRRMKEHLAEWRKFELNELWENANEQKWRAKKRIQMKRRAEQKRKWKVLYYTQSGKPDQKRRYGQPWDPSCFKNTLTPSIGNTETMGKDIAAQVHSQTSANQFLQYGALLEPVMEGMAIMQEKLTGKKPDVLEVVEGKNYRTKAQIRREEQARQESARAALEARQAEEDRQRALDEENSAQQGGGGAMKGLVTLAAGANRYRNGSASRESSTSTETAGRPAQRGGAAKDSGAAAQDNGAAPGQAARKAPVDPLEGKNFGSRRKRKKKFRSRIPWELLDNLDAQKQAVEDVGKAQYEARRASAETRGSSR